MARAPKKTPAKKKATKSAGGRPPKYDPKVHPRLFLAHRIMGKTIRQVAVELEVTPETLYAWRDKYPEFSEQMAAAEDERNQLVANSLYNRARGYNYRSTQVEYGEDGKIIKRVRKTHHIPAETSAATVFLTNRDKDNWKQKQVLEHDVSDSLADRLDRATRRHRESRGED